MSDWQLGAGRFLLGTAIFIIGLLLAQLNYKALAHSGLGQGRLLAQGARLLVIALTVAIAVPQFWFTPPPPTASANKPQVSISQLAQRTVPRPGKSGYQLVFADEFDTPRLNNSFWMDLWPWNGRTNNTHYLAYYAADALNLQEGKLRIKAEKRPMSGYQYTTGLISSYKRNLWQYGYFEMRAKLPRGRGMWPAWWLVPTGSWPPEIDMFEMLGHEPNKLYLSNHWTKPDGKPTADMFEYVGPDFSQDYHTYGLEWLPDRITWFVDQKAVAETTQHIPHMPMYMLSNISVGGNWPGAPDASTPFPSYMDIDYIRVLQRS